MRYRCKPECNSNNLKVRAVLFKNNTEHAQEYCEVCGGTSFVSRQRLPKNSVAIPLNRKVTKNLPDFVDKPTKINRILWAHLVEIERLTKTTRKNIEDVMNERELSSDINRWFDLVETSDIQLKDPKDFCDALAKYGVDPTKLF